MGLFTPRHLQARQADDLKNFIRQANDELFNNGNPDYAETVFAADYEGGEPADIKKYVSKLRSAFPDLHVTVGEFVVDGDRVAWVRTHRGTHQKQYPGVPASGKIITWRAMARIR